MAPPVKFGLRVLAKGARPEKAPTLRDVLEDGSFDRSRRRAPDSVVLKYRLTRLLMCLVVELENHRWPCRPCCFRTAAGWIGCRPTLRIGICCSSPWRGRVTSATLTRTAFAVLATATRRRRRVAGPHIVPTDAMMKDLMFTSRRRW